MPVPVNGYDPRSPSPSAQLYARPPSTKPVLATPPSSPPSKSTTASPGLIGSVASLSSPSGSRTALDRARAAYRTAAKAFLHRDYDGTWLALDKTEATVRSAVPSDVDARWWVESGKGGDEDEGELLEVLRKVQILRITFVATLSATPPSARPPTFSSPTLAAWLSLPPETLVYALWAALTQPNVGPSRDAPTPLADPHLTALHPSLATATALAALKVSAPASAKAVCEAWFGAVMGDDLLCEKVLALEATDDSPPAPVNGEVAGSASTTTAVGAYARLVEVYTVHVLGALEEWADAAEFIRGQSKDSGGFLSTPAVEGMLHTLHATHAHRAKVQAQIASRAKDRAQAQKRAKAQREREEAARAAKAEAEAAEVPARTKEEKGKARERKAEEKDGRLEGGSNSTALTQRQPRGFAALRAALSEHLVPPAATSSTSTTVTRDGLWSLIRLYLPPFLARDPFRLVSAVLCLVAFGSVLRRRILSVPRGPALTAAERARARLRAAGTAGGAGAGGVRGALAKAYAKVADTVRMGTQVTYL